MAEVPLIPVVDDKYRSTILGYAKREADGYLTFRVKVDDLKALENRLDMSEQIIEFMLGFLFRPGPEKQELAALDKED